MRTNGNVTCAMMSVLESTQINSTLLTIKSQISIIKSSGELCDDVQSREFMNKKSSNSCTVPKELILSNGRSTPQLKSQVRILHREAKSPSNISENHFNDLRTVSNHRSSKHCKSLQQRETEYAQARLRIFGCQPPDNNANGSETDRNLAKTAGIQRKRTFGVTKCATTPPAPSPVSNHPKGTLLRRPPNGANSIDTQLDPS